MCPRARFLDSVGNMPKKGMKKGAAKRAKAPPMKAKRRAAAALKKKGATKHTPSKKDPRC